ncbi:MAG: hypothetical protein EXR73_06290 [Myxococcales bacterium]|nr:hypothetical protein [Myxococcales bacterium]
MKLCRVLGNVVATVKHASYHGHKLMIVQPVDEAQREVGASFLAVDLVQAGAGDLVLVMQEGNGVRQVLKAPEGKDAKIPIRSVVIGIVDAVSTS